MIADIIRRHGRFVFGYLESGKFKHCSNTLQHFDVLGMCISISVHTNKVGVRVCIHIGVGFGVACSEQKAMREPQLAEQQ